MLNTNQTVTHQVPDGVLTAYAAGSLPEAFNVVVAAHVSLCDEARVRLNALEAVGGAVLEEQDQVEMSYGSFEATLRLIANDASTPVEQIMHQTEDAVLPKPLIEYLPDGLDGVKWRALGKGVKQAILPTTRDASVRLLSIPGGVEMPDHGHHGTEMTLVLQGAFLDGDERFGRGDIEVVNEDHHHTPIAEEGETCICLAASDAPLRFDGLLPKIAQPFFRI